MGNGGFGFLAFPANTLAHWVISLTLVNWLLKLFNYCQSSLIAKRNDSEHLFSHSVSSDFFGTFTYPSPWGSKTWCLTKLYWSNYTRQHSLVGGLVLLEAGTFQQSWKLSKWVVSISVSSTTQNTGQCCLQSTQCPYPIQWIVVVDEQSLSHLLWKGDVTSLYHSCSI